MKTTGARAAAGFGPRRRGSSYDWRLMVLLGGIGVLMVAAGWVATGKGPQDAAPALAVSVAAQALPLEGAAGGGPHRYVLVLAAMATGQEDAVARFRDGQTYDFIVMQDGREVWRWSHDRAFHQAAHERRFPAGELVVFTAVWDGRDAAGRQVTGTVEVRGVLTADPAFITEPVVLELQ
ncbi:MAG TPA: BsuPI-related putative proteinase inhibitor [Limnochordales bacterium]